MPLRTERFDIDEAVADLEADLEDLADEIAQIPPDERTTDNPEYLQLTDEAGTVERYLGGIDWLREEYGDDAEFELAGLNTQEVLVIGDRVDDLRQETATPTKSASNVSSVFWVAQGLQDAPFVDAGDDFETRCAVVRSLPKQVTEWLEEQINDLTTVGEREGNSFGELVEEMTERYHPTSS